MTKLKDSNIEVTYSKDEDRVTIDTGAGYVTLNMEDVQAVIQELKNAQYYASRTPVKDAKYYGRL